MSKSAKIWLIVATVLTVAGLVIFAGVMANYKMDFSKFVTEKQITKTQEITDNFDKISIDVDTTDVEFVLSQDGKCKIVCAEAEKLEHEAVVQNGTLTIKMTDNRRWYDHIGIFMGDYKITVYLPQQNYASVLIDTDTGDITLPKDFSFENIKIEGDTADVACGASVSGALGIELSTGDVKLDGITAGEINLATSTGDIYINRVTTTGNINVETDTGDMTFKDTISLAALNVESDTGDVKIENSDAGELFIETDTGDVRGSLLSDKVFIVSSDTGRILVPESLSGGKCKITTDTGDVQIKIN